MRQRFGVELQELIRGSAHRARNEQIASILSAARRLVARLFSSFSIRGGSALFLRCVPPLDCRSPLQTGNVDLIALRVELDPQGRFTVQ
jgi:hypothetical protein